MNFAFARELLQMLGKSMSKIPDMLQQECTLDELLGEDDVVEEAKMGNDRLIKFLCLEENLQKLVQYALSEPQTNGSRNEQFR